MASPSDVFQRLVGLETEYALLIPAQPADRIAGSGQRVTNRYSLFRELVAVLGTKIPCARPAT